jgi:putative ABC transport system ATP-binding protein
MLTSEVPVISMRNVNHYYGVGELRRQVLFDVTCDIWPGEIVIVTGPSGSGKTTMLTLVGALRSVQEGSVKILGEELSGARQSTLVRIRENVGFIFQLHNLLECCSALQNVELALGVRPLPRSEVRLKSRSMLEAVGLGDHLDYAPPQLSGGQRQRVAIARALVRRPKIVLADEPTAALDKHSGRDVVELLRQLARREGCAVLLVTHDHRILDIADRLMVVEDGRVESAGLVTTPYEGHLLTALACMNSAEDIEIILDRATEGTFLDVLKELGAESQQFLNVLDMGEHQNAGRLFENLLRAIFGKIVRLLDAEGCCLLMIREGTWQQTVAHGVPGRPCANVAEQATESGEVLSLSGAALDAGTRSILAVPIVGRYGATLGVVQVVNKRGECSFNDADKRAFRDVTTPLTLIVQALERVLQVK